MPSSRKSEQRDPHDYSHFLRLADPVFLVGGQAVNLWAERYGEQVQEFAPFVSRDADVLGGRSQLEQLAKANRVKAQFFPLRPPTNEVGVIRPQTGAGETLLIEVLRTVHGVTDAEMRTPSYLFEIGDDATQVLVPGPIALLQAKIANVADLNQRGRQDSRHVSILLRLLPDYLRDLSSLASSNPEALSEKSLLQLFQRLLEVVQPVKAQKVLSTLGENPRDLFRDIDTEGLPRITKFMNERVPGPSEKKAANNVPLRSSDIVLGIDVGGARKGFHAVALSASREVVTEPVRLATADEIGSLVAELKPTVIAIDAPCRWSDDTSREAERTLARAGIRSFCTPSRPRAKQNLTFYGWMFQGEAAFAAATATHPHFDGEKSVRGHTIEVFPNATTIALTGQANPPGIGKNPWRRGLLAEQGIDPAQFTNIDHVDAALCALTGLHALAGNFTTYGDKAGGYLIAPIGSEDEQISSTAVKAQR